MSMHIRLDRIVAIKVPAQHLSAKGQFTERFERRRAAVRSSRSPSGQKASLFKAAAHPKISQIVDRVTLVDAQFKALLPTLNGATRGCGYAVGAENMARRWRSDLKAVILFVQEAWGSVG